MEQSTARIVKALHTTRARRRLAGMMSRKVGRRRTWCGWPKHTAVQRRFLDMLIRIGLAAHPGQAKLTTQIARYYSDNYVYELCRSPIWEGMRVVARDIILRGADSSFGETPRAAHLAYVLAHHEELRVENVSRYSELTTCNLGLEQYSFFRDAHQEAREELELDKHVGQAIRSIADEL